MLRLRRPTPLMLVGLGVVATLSGCWPSGAGVAAPTRDPAVEPAATALPRADHVLMVIFENKTADQVVGSADAPFLNSIARSGLMFTDAHAEAHPSQPNYIALLSGTTHDVRDDDCPVQLSGPNLPSQLLAAGDTFVGYSEGMPVAGFTGCNDNGYARRHNPWVDFDDLPTSVNQPLSALPSDYSALPTVSMVVPDVCHDMHDCPVAVGDSWARDFLTPYLQWASTHNSLLIVTFDENDGDEDTNHIPTFLVGPMIRAGTTTQRIDHYSLLRTLEDMYGLQPIGRSANAQPLLQPG